MYLAVKSLHLISVVSWFAGLFYIFRLFVYHRQKCDSLEVCEVLKTMERKLLRFIMFPAMILTLGTGLGMVFMSPMFWQQSWLHFKLASVAGLLAYHGFSIHTHRRFAERDFFLTEKACRMINEVPTIFLIVIVPLVIFKPF